MNKIQIITTTSTIEGWEIQKYFGIVTHQVVIGANIFRDVFASFTDIFGGTSKGYQKDLKNMEIIAIKNLKEKASKLGANIIIGLRLDFDEISGGSKSMFMVSASGTAVYGVTKNKQSKIINENNNEITLDRLKYEIKKDQLKNELKSEDYIIENKKQIEELTRYKIGAILKIVKYMREISTPMYINEEDLYFNPYKDTFVNYFGSISKKELNEFLISEYFIGLKRFTTKRLLEILEAIEWFDYGVINFLLDSTESLAHTKVLYMLNFRKSIYQKKDIDELVKISGKINIVFKQYPKLIITKGKFGKEKEGWKCWNCGELMPSNISVCKTSNCHSNIYGIRNNLIDPFELSNELLKETEKLKELLGSSISNWQF